MKRRFGVAIACAVWTLQTHALAQERVECSAERLGVTYDVRLEGAPDHRSMSVIDSRGNRASGRATVYRHGTRYYLHGEPGAGFKLSIDGNATNLCFENGGNDCHACKPIASRRERYREKSSCVTSTPYGRYVVTLYRTNEPSPEMVIEDESGELASGAADYGFYQEGIAHLQIGPSEAYTYYEYANTLCLVDPRECYACDNPSRDEVEQTQTLPPTTLARCLASNGIEAELTAQAGDVFLSISSHRQWLGIGGDIGSYEGPATNLGADRWRIEDWVLTLSGSVAELCSPSQGCAPCTTEGLDELP